MKLWKTDDNAGGAVQNKVGAGRIVVAIAAFVIVAAAIALGASRGRNEQTDSNSTKIAETTSTQENDEDGDFEHMIESGRLIHESSMSYDSDSDLAAVSEERSKASETSTAAAGSGISPEFKQQVDDIVAFYENYCRFLKNYTSAAVSGNYTDMFNEYSRFMSDYAEYSDRLNKLNSSQSSMTPEELDYWMEAYTKIMKMLISAGR